jgi:hypothetical protein
VRFITTHGFFSLGRISILKADGVKKAEPPGEAMIY